MGVCFDPFFCLDWQRLSCLGLSDDTLMLYSRVSLQRRTETNIYGNTWFPNGSWSLSKFDKSTELRSTALHCDWILWNGTSVGMAQELNAYVCIEFATESLTQPCSYSNDQQLNFGTSYTENFDRDAHRDLTSTGYWDFVEESRLSCMSTISLDHTDNTIFTA